MKFITLKTSATGQAIEAIDKRLSEIHSNVTVMANKYGFNQWRVFDWPHFGEIAAVMFDDTPDLKVWKSIKNGGYMPRLNSKLGKQIAADLESCGHIRDIDFCRAIGIEYDFGISPGFALPKDGLYFGISLNDTWKYTPPADVEEVTTSRYVELFLQA